MSSFFKMRTNFIPLVVFCLLSCSASRSVYRISGEWNVVGLNGQKVVPADNTPFLGFDLHEGRIYGFTGCNRLTAPLNSEALAQGKVDFSQMGCTRMLCHDAKYENAFLDALNSAGTLTIENDTLRMFNQAGEEVLTFLKK